jgi:hypothetical protein
VDKRGVEKNDHVFELLLVLSSIIAAALVNNSKEKEDWS